MMVSVKRDTTRDLFLATLNLVKENGHYQKAEKIIDYVLPNEAQSGAYEIIELSDYGFDFMATPIFGSNEGIYINCYVVGSYTEQERTFLNRNTNQIEKEMRRHIGTLKTLKTDLESMQVMGELCGSLTYYAREYVNLNIERYSPTKELEWFQRCRSVGDAYNRYLSELVASIPSVGQCQKCAGAGCLGKQDGCVVGIDRYIRKETGRHNCPTRPSNDERNPYFHLLGCRYDILNDSFEWYVNILKSEFPELTLSQVLGYVHAWLCTRPQEFNAGQ